MNSVKAILDANRNSLMLLDLKFSIGTLGFGAGAFIASLYGMNLENFIEESNLGFAGITGLSLVCAVGVWTAGLKKLGRVKRVSMWGEQGSRSRGWGTDAHKPLPVLPGESKVERQRNLELTRVESGEDGARISEGLEAVDMFSTVNEQKPEKEK